MLLTILLLITIIFILDRCYPPVIQPLQKISRVVTDRNGQWLSAFPNSDGRWRFPAMIDAIDPEFIDNLVFFEDKRFYSHHGVDLRAMLRAAYQWLTNRRIISGASTITMQLARLLEPHPRTLTSKLIESLRALQLEYHFTKNEILQMYLTMAPYGGNLEGIEAASLAWFNKHPRVLSNAEAALLAVLPQQPSRLRPDRHSLLARDARTKVLKRLQLHGHLDRPQVEAALREPVPTQRHSFANRAIHLSRRAAAGNSAELVSTTLDAAIQDRIERLARRRAASWEAGVTMAALVIENASGEIMAYLGSHDQFDTQASGYIDMVQAVRSPGSTLKPLIYGLGFELNLIHPRTLINDIPHLFGDYAPVNFDGRYAGNVTIVEALQHSLNLPAVAVLERVTPTLAADRISRAAGALKWKGGGKAGLPLALGGVGATLQQLVTLYSAFPREGRAITPVWQQTGHAEQRKTPLLSAKAAAWINRILIDILPPPEHEATHSSIAYKTGTSYGYRDAWAIGYNAKYTVGVWVGRADGKPRPGHAGRDVAAPLLFDIIEFLPAGTERLTASWYGTPPQALRHFGTEIEHQSLFPLHIHVPGGGGRLRPVGGCFSTAVQFSVSAGKPPYYWFINGEPRQQTQQPRFDWMPETRGQIDVRVMDAGAREGGAAVWIDGKTCPSPLN
ncbi:MAG: penicillin-binding protein 1C [Gammaproteobacteria bacterium]|nr:penicillin-binding protein 1C [Gammaproteobacteria bacterium]